MDANADCGKGALHPRPETQRVEDRIEPVGQDTIVTIEAVPVVPGVVARRLNDAGSLQGADDSRHTARPMRPGVNFIRHHAGYRGAGPNDGRANRGKPDQADSSDRNPCRRAAPHDAARREGNRIAVMKAIRPDNVATDDRRFRIAEPVLPPMAQASQEIGDQQADNEFAEDLRGVHPAPPAEYRGPQSRSSGRPYPSDHRSALAHQRLLYGL